jgi:hypothetical protein
MCASIASFAQEGQRPAPLPNQRLQVEKVPSAAKAGAARTTSSLQWTLQQELLHALVSNVSPARIIASTSQAANASSPAIALVLKEQRLGAQTLLKPTPQLGPGQTLSSPGVRNSSPGTTNQPTLMNNATAGAHTLNSPPQTQICVEGGITAVSGKKTVAFTPVAGPDGTYVIQGCGFGTQPGRVYLSSLHYSQNISPVSGATQAIPFRPNPDQLQFEIAPADWSERQIVVHIDPNASGYYDTDPVTLVVQIAGGQQYKSGGLMPGVHYSFVAARAAQLLPFSPYLVNVPYTFDSQGRQVPIYAGSSAAPLFSTNHTVVVVRQVIGATFSNSLPDHVLVVPPEQGQYGGAELMTGFQVTGVQFYHADLPKVACIYVRPGNTQYTTSGDWGVGDSQWGEYDVSWQEQSCTSTSGGAGGHTQSVSAYALDITVVGPRGVPPWRWQSGYK